MNNQRPVRVLVIDDSAFIRQFLTDTLNSAGDLKVIATASDPTKAIEIMKQRECDVITLDVEMPNMDGLDFLRYLMRFNPKPVVMVSSWTRENSEAALKALSLGAVDFVSKPTVGFREGMSLLKEEIITKVRNAALAKVTKIPLKQPQAPPPPAGEGTDIEVTTDKVIAIGASTGGTVALTEILKELHPNVPGIIIIQHMPPMFTRSFAESLQQSSRLRVKEAGDNEQLLSGHALVVPGGKSLEVKRSGAKYIVKTGPPLGHSIYNPSIDHTLISVAKAAGRNSMGIILTGMGDDGAKGLKSMRDAGAYTIAQDENTSVIYGMPQKAWEIQAAVKQVPLSGIASEIHKWAGI